MPWDVPHMHIMTILTDSERQEITAALWKEMREIYYGRNMPAV